MNKYIKYSILIALVLIVVMGISVHAAGAQSTSYDSNASAVKAMQDAVKNSPPSIWTIIGNIFSNPQGFITGLLAIVAWAVMSVAAWLLAAAGILLNVAMYLTTNLGLFINQSPVIYTVWSIIRDISSTLLIFFILYAAIQKILGLEPAGFGELIKNIIIVGVLINFSFFFTRVLIDVSNIVSLEFYNAISPPMQGIKTTGDITNLDSMVDTMTRGKGMSDILMGSLQVQSFWSVKGTRLSDILGSNNVSVNLNILILEVAGLVVVSITIINFLIIALVCVARIAILLFLLAFSPVWIAAMGMPKLNDISKIWVKQFKIQLIFLPVYLAFLYVALRIVTASNLSQMVTASATGNTDNPWGGIINLTVGFAIIIFLLNIPIVAAAQVAGGSVGFIDKAYKGLKSKAVGMAKGTGTWTARNTAGRLASRVNESNVMRNMYANNPSLGRFVSSGVSKISSAGFGGGKEAGFDQVRKKQIEARTKFISGLGYDDRKLEDTLDTELAPLDKELNSKKRTIGQYENRVANSTSPAAKQLAQETLDRHKDELSQLIKTREEKKKQVEELIKNERKMTAVKEYEKQPVHRKILESATGRRAGRGASKFNKAVAAAVRKGKTPTDELIAALKGELGNKDKESKSGDDKKS